MSPPFVANIFYYYSRTKTFFALCSCVFIHDPRVKGSEEANLYVSHGVKGGGGASAAASASANANTAATASASPSSAASFFFPDIVRDIDSTEV